MNKRIVITGIGIVTPIGIGKDKFWEACKRGSSGIKRITAFNTDSYSTKIAGEIKDFKQEEYLSDKKVDRMDRFSQFAIAASKLAIKDAGLDLENEERERIGVYIGSGLGGMVTKERHMNILYEKKPKYVHPLYIQMMTLNAAAGEVSIEFGLKGPNLTTATACTSGIHSIALALNEMQLNDIDMIIAGGTDAPILPLVSKSFDSMGILSRMDDEPERACKPFDKERDGVILGEGAGIVVIETLEHAKKRDAGIYAEIISYAMANDSFYSLNSGANVDEWAKVIQLALKDALLKPEDIDYINAHGISGQLDDLCETEAIKKVFSDYAYEIPISSTKSMIGHTIGAAGAIELIVCALSISDGIIPPTINYEYPDPDCNLDYVPNSAREEEVKVALTNSFGFGGNNAAMIIKKYKK